MGKPQTTPIVPRSLQPGERHLEWAEWRMGEDGRYERSGATSDTQARLTESLAEQIADEQMRQLAELERPPDPAVVRETLRHAAERVLDR